MLKHSLLLQATGKVDPLEFARLNNEMKFSMETKVAFFKRLASDCYYGLPHFKCVLETVQDGWEKMQVYRLPSVFDDPNHSCIARCRYMLQDHLIMVHQVLEDIEDYALFLIVFDKFFEHSLQVGEEHLMREQILSEFYAVEYFNRKFVKDPDWFNLGLRIDADTVTEGSWYRRVESVYHNGVGAYPSQLPCLTVYEKRSFVQEARYNIIQFARALPEDKVFRFLRQFM